MPIETDIQALTKAVTENTAAILKLCATAQPVETPKGKAEKRTEKQTEAQVEQKPALTIQDVRAAAQKLLDAGRVDLIRPLLPKYGVEKISAAAPEKYAEVVADLTAALVQAEKEKAASPV